MVRHATYAVLVLSGAGPGAWAQLPADSSTVRDRFASATTAQLDSLYGPPDEVLSRPQPPGSLPYEVWKYTRHRQLKYCFIDLTRFGNYVLLWTNDRQESSEPNWRQLLGYEAYEEVVRF